MIVTISARPSPVTLIAAALVVGGAYGMTRQDAGSEARCGDEDPGCEERRVATFAQTDAPPTFRAADVCLDAGYLCAEIEQAGSVRLQRWRDFSGTMVVHVPRPDFEGPGAALELQRAAVLGIRAWNNQPFPIMVDTRGDREPHMSVRWTSSLGGTRIGVARTQWSPSHGLHVLSIELTTRSPHRPAQPADARSVRLTAAHEMGHALGLPHSDSSHDVMYPTNTATAVSARDRRSMEVLYELEDGSEIVR